MLQRQLVNYARRGAQKSPARPAIGDYEFDYCFSCFGGWLQAKREIFVAFIYTRRAVTDSASTRRSRRQRFGLHNDYTTTHYGFGDSPYRLLDFEFTRYGFALPPNRTGAEACSIRRALLGTEKYAIARTRSPTRGTRALPRLIAQRAQLPFEAFVLCSKGISSAPNNLIKASTCCSKRDKSRI